MTGLDWEEVKRLAADFQRAQLSETVQRLSERNCVEIITKLIEVKLLDVIFTKDGKEYITPKQLTREIRDELYLRGGRINLVELAKILNVDLSHISARATEIERSDYGVSLVLGQLIDKSYINTLAQEINEKLAQQGQVAVGDLTRLYDLPGDYLQNVIEKQLGKLIHGKQDKSDPRIFFTDAFVARNKACIRGALTAVTRPTPVSALLNQCGVQDRVFFSIIDSLNGNKQIPGVVSGKQGNNSMYIPSMYSKSQTDWINNFYKQNGYLEYDSLIRLGVFDPKALIQRQFSGEKLLFLPSCAVGSQLFAQVEAEVEDVLTSGSWVDVMPHLPSACEARDGQELLQEVLKHYVNKNVNIFSDTIVVSDGFLQKLIAAFESTVQKKAEEIVESGVYLQTKIEKVPSSRNVEPDDVDTKTDRREERRKKATGGKGGGGTQGRETKTKSTKKKQRGRTGADDSNEDFSGETGRKVKVQPKNDFISISNVKRILLEQDTLQDDEASELVSDLTNYLHPIINNQVMSSAETIYEKNVASSAQIRRKTHSELQDKINALLSDVRLYEKGIACFPNTEVQQQITKYLLKSLCTDIANEIFSYVAQENMIQFDPSKDINPEIRIKIINELQNEAKDAFLKLHKSLNGTSIDDFVSLTEVAMGPGICDMVVRKADKKKERLQIFAHRQAMLEKLEISNDPAVVLHLTALILFQGVTQNMLHASGRYVSAILTFLQTHLPADTYNVLQKYHDQVLKLLTCGNDEDTRRQVANALEEDMTNIKDIVKSFKR